MKPSYMGFGFDREVKKMSREVHTKHRSVVFAVVIVFALAGCQKEARATLVETYFPLEVGNSWTYINAQYVRNPNEPPQPPPPPGSVVRLTFTITGTEEIDGHTYYVFNDYFYIFTPPPNGWPLTMGRETLFRYDSIADTVIMRPRGSTIERIRYDFTGDEWDAGAMIGGCRLKESEVTCNVPAGELSDCVNFGFGRSSSDPDYYSYGEYLAPNVGNIKYVRPGSGLSEGSRVTFVLESYTIVPEPSTLLLLGLGAILLRKRK